MCMYTSYISLVFIFIIPKEELDKEENPNILCLEVRELHSLYIAICLFCVVVS